MLAATFNRYPSPMLRAVALLLLRTVEAFAPAP
jgi:hypothetical protein